MRALLLALWPGLALAAGGYDYNHAHVRWHTLETEHFYFHWPESTFDKDNPRYFTTEFTAAELSRIAEASYPAITGQFDYDLIEKTHVVIYDQDLGWEGNGFAIAESDWTGFAADWGPTFRERGRMEFLSDVFVHEFAHIVSLKAFLPWSESTTGFELGGLVQDEEHLRRWGAQTKPPINGSLGFYLIGYAHSPYWWAEGGAEYWSHEAGYNFWGTSREAFLRMSVYEDRVLTLDEWTTRIDKEGMDGERGYNHGYAFGLWLRRRLGTEAMTDMARISAERWHWTWDQVVEEATGVPMEQLYEEWRAFLDDHYGAQVAAIEAEGVVAGRELTLTKPEWEEPVDEDWPKRSKKKRDEDMDGDTAWMELPVYSPDGRYLAWFEHGLNVMAIEPGKWGALGGEYLDEEPKAQTAALKKTWFDDLPLWHRVDFSPDSTRIVVTGVEDLDPKALRDAGLTFNADGYNWSQLWVGTVEEPDGRLKVRWEKVPNTLRATEATWHPDGTTLAFARYGDGGHEIWTVGADGSDPKQLTHFGDGTQVQALDWSPDGEHLLVSLYRTHQQDLWLLAPKTGAWTRLTDSRADETDPSFGPDGRIWFASDLTSVFDVYSLDPKRHAVKRHTNVIGGAYGPWVTPEGHLLYTAITGHGFRIMGVPGDDLLQVDVDYDGLCRSGNCADAEAEISWRPEVRDVRATSRRYNPFHSSMPLSVWPMARLSDKNVEVGGQLYLGDYLEKHYFEGMVTFGKDNYLYGAYWNNMWWPTIGVGASRYSYKGTYSYGTDLDDLPETPELSVVDVKFEQLSDDAWLMLSYMPSWYLWLGVMGDVVRYSFRDGGDGSKWTPYQVNGGVSLFGEWTPSGSSYSGDDWINPRGGRRFYFDVGRRWTAVIDPEVAGGVYDDGDLLERYGYWRLSASWTEFIAVPWAERHTLQIDLEAGWIDKNVMGWDEFIAGGRHPYDWGSGTIGNNVQFSGYQGWSLSGETMLIANLSYRFPLVRRLGVKVGPAYFDSVYLQVFGSAGNLWSFRPAGQVHVEGGYVVPDIPGNVVREVPFVDYSYKNSPQDRPNYVLADAGIELRVRSFIWNDFDWDHFVRVSYGFMPTSGYGDVDGDLVQTSVARDARSELSAEVEEPTLRIYLGIGTGW